MRAGGNAVWTPECSKARNQLCDVLAQKLQLVIPKPGVPYIIYLDASAEGMSAVLC